MTARSAMKTIASLLLSTLLAGIAAAGQITIFNDTSELRFVRITHKGQKLAATWLISGQRVVVQVDDTRRGKPLLMVDVPNLAKEKREREVKFHYLPKKPTPLFFNLSWFKRSIDS
jgi:hypothetical protein